MGQSHTTPLSICKEYLNHPLGLTLSTPGLVIPYKLYVNCQFIDRHENKKTLEKFEKKKKHFTEKGDTHDKVVVLSLVLESSIEASFQVKAELHFPSTLFISIYFKNVFSVFLFLS